MTGNNKLSKKKVFSKYNMLVLALFIASLIVGFQNCTNNTNFSSLEPKPCEKQYPTMAERCALPDNNSCKLKKEKCKDNTFSSSDCPEGSNALFSQNIPDWSAEIAKNDFKDNGNGRLCSKAYNVCYSRLEIVATKDGAYQLCAFF